MTPSRQYSRSVATPQNDNIFDNKIIRSEGEIQLQQIQKTSVTQPKKMKNSGGMFSSLFSKFRTWTDKNRQAFTGYSTILKTAIAQQVTIISYIPLSPMSHILVC